MSKNIVVITSMSGEVDISYKEICLNTWNYWCKKHNVELVVLDTELVDINYMKPTWQRWYVLDVLESNGIDYNQVALVDVDTMIHWNAPNFFDETNNQFSACVDNDNVGWVKQSIDGYRKYFENDLDWEKYFNCGFIVINKTHKLLCDKITKFRNENHSDMVYLQNTLRKGTDQTPVNYIVNDSEFTVNYLSKKWNLTHLNRKEILQNLMFVDLGWVWHFNGFDKNQRFQIMNSVWENIKQNYE